MEITFGFRAGAAILAGLALTACAASAATSRRAGTSSTAQGTVVSAERVAHMSRAMVARRLAGFDPALASPAPRHAVDTYRVVYRTVSPDGRPTTASGVVSLPGGGDGGRLRAVSFAHGTHVDRRIAGSVNPEGQSRMAAIYYAGAGYAGVAPDYLGQGLGPGLHPYGHAATEASASLDLLRAARQVAARDGRSLERRVLVTGFSQGGQAAMALARALDRGDDPYLRPAAVAPISGPFDIQHAQLPASFAAGGGLDPRASVFYLSYLLVTADRLRDIYRSPAEAFQPPYDGRVERLFDGRHGDLEEIGPQLPARIGDLLTPRFVRWLGRPDGRLLAAIRDWDGTCDWRPSVPVRLYAASGDEQVTFDNTRSCARALSGARPTVIDYGPRTRHFETLSRGLPDTLRWFRTL